MRAERVAARGPANGSGRAPRRCELGSHRISNQCEHFRTLRIPFVRNSDRCEFLQQLANRRFASLRKAELALSAEARILVVEDSDAIRLPVATALSAQGFELAGRLTETILKLECGPSRPIW